MAKQWCINGTSLDTSKYSYPTPVIGLYIVAGSVVCCLSIVYDIFAGFRGRKPWLPCQLFSLNAFTLTVLQVATKLTVDLTTPMPSAQDQLSKLTGTTCLCVSMCFLFPSLGLSRADEAFSNLTALTILVITVVVNVCIQIGTGAIFSYLVEHVMIMFCMLDAVQVLWKYNEFIEILGTHKGHLRNNNMDLLVKGEETSLFQRLKLCYIYGYQSNPQFLLLHIDCGLTVMCLICFLVLVEALFRYAVLKSPKFCEGISDYKWSVWMVVGTQILLVLITTAFAVFRKIKCLRGLSNVITFNELWKYSYVHLSVHTSLSENFFIYLWGVLCVAASPFHVLVTLLSRILYFICNEILKARDNASATSSQEIKIEFERRRIAVIDWALSIAEEDLNKWIEKKRRVSPKHLIELLSQRNASRESLTRQLSLHHQSQFDPSNNGLNISSLSMLMLVKMAEIILPADSLMRFSLMSHTMEEVFAIICFIDSKMMMNSTIEGQWKCKFAEVMHSDKSWFKKQKILKKAKTKKSKKNVTNADQQQLQQTRQPELDDAIAIVEELCDIEPFDLAKDEARAVATFTKSSGSSASTIEELYDQMEQLFVDMLNEFLTLLPKAIFKDVIESEVGQYVDKVKGALEFLCQLESIEERVQWSFPERSNINKLISIQAPTV